MVALDGDWGSGKSHFLKLWTGSHAEFLAEDKQQDKDQKIAKVIYFDAFERDYLDNPFVSLVAAITKAQEEAAEDKSVAEEVLPRLKKFATALLPAVARIGLQAASAGLPEHIGKAFGDAARVATEGMGSEAEKAFDAFWQLEERRAAAIEGFREALAKLAADQPLILVIDELDRCRPDFALSLLEVVKHFFAVKGVRFVLGIRLAALEESVRHRYGPGTDAALYLQKFLHLRVSLPTDTDIAPWRVHFANVCERLEVSKGLTEGCTDILSTLVRSPPTLREVERIAMRLALFPRTDPSRNREFLKDFVLSAAVLEVKNPDAYRDLRAGKLSYDAIERTFEFPNKDTDAFEFKKYHVNMWRYLLQGDITGMKTELQIMPELDDRHQWLKRRLATHFDTLRPT